MCRDYTQFLLPGDLAAGAPFCGPEVGDPTGLLLGMSLDAGVATPVLFDPTFGPTVGRRHHDRQLPLRLDRDAR